MLSEAVSRETTGSRVSAVCKETVYAVTHVVRVTPGCLSPLASSDQHLVLRKSCRQDSQCMSSDRPDTDM